MKGAMSRPGSRLSSDLPVAICQAPGVVRSQESFSCFADGDQSDVVILGLRAGKIADVIDDSPHNCLGAITRAGPDGLDRALKAKFVSFRI